MSDVLNKEETLLVMGAFYKACLEVRKNEMGKSEEDVEVKRKAVKDVQYVKSDPFSSLGEGKELDPEEREEFIKSKM